MKNRKSRVSLLLAACLILSAVFACSASAATFTITPKAGEGGIITPGDPQTAEEGTPIGFTATPNLGYEVDGWYIGSMRVQNGGLKCRFVVSVADFDVTVTFKQASGKQFSVLPIAGANGSISPSADQKIEQGASVTFTATPDSGYAVDAWYELDGGMLQNGGNTLTITPTKDTTVIVNFKSVSVAYTVSAGAGEGGTVSPAAKQTVEKGASVTFTAKPNDGYEVDAWTLNGDTLQKGGKTLTFIPQADSAVVVSFKRQPLSLRIPCRRTPARTALSRPATRSA